jgi:hypothetical protein
MGIQIYIAIAVAILLAALGGGTYYYHSQYEAEVTKEAVLVSKNAELVDKINQDAIAVNQYKADSDKRAADAKTALAASQKQLQDYTKKAQAILLAKAQTPDNLCLSSNFLFNDFIGGLKK